MAGRNGGTYLSDIQYAKVNNGGSGKTGAWTTNTNALPTARTGGAAAKWNNFLYYVGGREGTSNQDNAAVATVNSDGSTGTWSYGSGVGGNLLFPAAAAYNGYLYWLGGMTGTTDSTGTAFVSYTPLNRSTGATGAWVSTNSYGTARSMATAVAYNGYLYIMGGQNTSGTALSDIQYAPINTNGTLGTWSSTTSFGGMAGKGVSAFAYGRRLYVVGGNDGSADQKYVRSAPINTNGTVGAWTTTSSTNNTHTLGSAVAQNGFVYAYGGYMNNMTANAPPIIEYAPINADGSVGTWQTTTAFMTPRHSAAGWIHEGRLYIAGGGSQKNGGNAYYSDVQYAALDTISRTARYSKLFSLGTQMSQANVGYNGQLGPGSSVTFTTAGNNGIFDTSASGTVDTLPDLGGVCTTEGVNETAYLHVTVMMDDSQMGTFGGSGLGYSNLTDMTVYYDNSQRLPTNLRLHGGKWFNNGSLNQLDTCIV